MQSVSLHMFVLNSRTGVDEVRDGVSLGRRRSNCQRMVSTTSPGRSRSHLEAICLCPVLCPDSDLGRQLRGWETPLPGILSCVAGREYCPVMEHPSGGLSAPHSRHLGCSNQPSVGFDLPESPYSQLASEQPKGHP